MYLPAQSPWNIVFLFIDIKRIIPEATSWKKKNSEIEVG